MGQNHSYERMKNPEAQSRYYRNSQSARLQNPSKSQDSKSSHSTLRNWNISWSHSSSEKDHLITKKNRNYRNTELAPRISVTYLGVLLQDDLRWEAHIFKMAWKVFAATCRLSWHRGCLTTANRHRLINALALPHVRYAAAVFTDISAVQQRRKQHLINACVRFISPLPRFSAVAFTRTALGIPSFFNIRHRAVGCLLQSIRLAPEDGAFLKTAVNRRTPLRRRLREASILNPPVSLSVTSRGSALLFFTRAARAWNKLTSSLRSLQSVNAIKRQLKKRAIVRSKTMNHSLFF